MDLHDDAINLSWNFIIEKPGTYQVDIISSETGSHGSPSGKVIILLKFVATVRSLKQKLLLIIRNTINVINIGKTFEQWQNNQFEKPGNYTLQLIPVVIKNNKVGFTFREIHLMPTK